ncbi:YkgJ family cysteine cluster protein [Desulfovibrio sp. JC010]|uniref:YkgJ family cysteine cluster protein n=1 Tax=Desulfovibrio sp. JC010 TaxID=2593641 RepID=UPI0013D5D7A6
MVDGLKHLQNGNGICIHLKGNLCSIYADRPSLCRYGSVREMYKDILTNNEFDELCELICNKLQKGNFDEVRSWATEEDSEAV